MSPLRGYIIQDAIVAFFYINIIPSGFDNTISACCIFYIKTVLLGCQMSIPKG